jgi:hypothetical protein
MKVGGKFGFDSLLPLFDSHLEDARRRGRISAVEIRTPDRFLIRTTGV